MIMTREAVIEVTAKECGLEPDKLEPDAKLTELDISSIDLASAIFALEEEFGVEVQPENISPDWTINQFLDHVMSLNR